MVMNHSVVHSLEMGNYIDCILVQGWHFRIYSVSDATLIKAIYLLGGEQSDC